ncbi:MAG: phosphonate ABC transporter, partial [Glaciimonas sp.]|nr:phosphonate ABC transporter [Glaciimonas sp.]
ALDPHLSVQTLIVLQQEELTRQATLVCSLHQVALARAHFPRIVGLRDGAIMFDQPRENVTDAMIAALYRGRDDASNQHSEDLSHAHLSLIDAATYTPRC